MSEINWLTLLKNEDVEGLWGALYQVISRHPAVRPLHFATDGAADASPFEINADLAQELFLELFQKQRFEHYLDSRYTSSEIENEIAHIEVPNLVGARLRKRYPESFRMARRVSALLKSSQLFCRLGEDPTSPAPKSGDEKPARRRGRPPNAAKKLATANGHAPAAHVPASIDDEDDLDGLDEFAGDAPGHARNGHHAEPKRKRMVNQVYALSAWKNRKPLRDHGHFSDLVKSVSMRKRDTRIVGRSGSSQLILSNPELEVLIVEIFNAIDSPADVRTIRQLVLSKIPLQDYNIASLDEELNPGNNGSTLRRDPADTRGTAEDFLLREEKDREASALASDFLHTLRRAVNDNERRFTRLLSTLWHCYYNPTNPSQLEIARLLGVSDSLVSDNRRLIEFELKKLSLSVDEGVIFSESLKSLVSSTA